MATTLVPLGRWPTRIHELELCLGGGKQPRSTPEAGLNADGGPTGSAARRREGEGENANGFFPPEAQSCGAKGPAYVCTQDIESTVSCEACAAQALSVGQQAENKRNNQRHCHSEHIKALVPLGPTCKWPPPQRNEGLDVFPVAMLIAALVVNLGYRQQRVKMRCRSIPFRSDIFGPDWDHHQLVNEQQPLAKLTPKNGPGERFS